MSFNEIMQAIATFIAFATLFIAQLRASRQQGERHGQLKQLVANLAIRVEVAEHAADAMHEIRIIVTRMEVLVATLADEVRMLRERRPDTG